MLQARAYVVYAVRTMPKRKWTAFSGQSAYLTATLEERLTRFEMIFFRLLHLLAHHPDFATSEESLPDIARYVIVLLYKEIQILNDGYRYIDFYLDLVASPDNIPLLFNLAMKAKTVRDIESHMYSEVCSCNVNVVMITQSHPWL